MSLAQQRQIDLLKRQVKDLKTETAELKRQMDLLLNQFHSRMAKAIDKVIADGIEVERPKVNRPIENQLAELLKESQ